LLSRRVLYISRMNKTSILALVAAGALAFGCGDKKDDTEGGDKPTGETKTGGETREPETKPEPTPKPKPTLAALAIPEWGIEMQAPEGAKLGDFDKGGDLPGNAKVEGACGEEEIEIYRYDGNELESQFKNSTGNMEHDAAYPVKELTDTGFTVKKTWKPPMGQVWTGEAATLVGKATYLCGLSTMLGVDEEASADCAIEVCSSIKASAAK
jgi:hypothetical protein